MNFKVIWSPSALGQLASLWADAKDRNAINAAVNEIDRVLGHHPTLAGESRADDDRILFVSPLAILFRVLLSERKSTIVSVGWSGKPV